MKKQRVKGKRRIREDSGHRRGDTGGAALEPSRHQEIVVKYEDTCGNSLFSLSKLCQEVMVFQ